MHTTYTHAVLEKRSAIEQPGSHLNETVIQVYLWTYVVEHHFFNRHMAISLDHLRKVTLLVLGLLLQLTETSITATARILRVLGV